MPVQATYDLPDHVRGDTFPALVYNVTVDGTPVDMTVAGRKARIDVRSHGDLVCRFSSETDDGRDYTITKTATGFSIDKQVIDIPDGAYAQDIQLTLDADDIYTYTAGSWTILPEQTHDR